MAISVTITESLQTVVANVPKSLTIETNVPSTIFYTLDGSTPTVDSLIYFEQLYLPTDKNPLIVKIWASSGSDESIVITEIYESTIVGARMSHAGTNGSSNLIDHFPFGASNATVSPVFGEQVGITVNDQSVTDYEGDGYSGYDNTGKGLFNLDRPKSEYEFVYSGTNRIGEQGRNIGTLPSTTILRAKEEIPTTSSTNDMFFNPKALVIFQSATDEENRDTVFLNKPHFNSDHGNRTNNRLRYNSYEGGKTFGASLRSYENPSRQIITHYYRDSISNQWIISETPFLKQEKVISVPGAGSSRVYRWLPFINTKYI